jgi:imidazolonepropionase-like amidohydrolase
LRSLIAVAVSALFLLHSTGHAQAPAETRYTVLMASKPAGVQTSTVRDGVREFTFEYNDRGRGPKLATRIQLDADGLPVRLETTGNDYLKAPVSETLTVSNGVVRWKSAAEAGEAPQTRKAFYVSMNGAPEEVALLAQALLRSPSKHLPLLPDGEAGIEPTAETMVKVGEDSRRVFSYRITGLGFAPTTVWLLEDGAFFASVSRWLSVIPEGWEKSEARLLKVQEAREARRTLELARSLTRRPETPLVLRGGDVFDAERGETRSGMTVVVEGNRIRAVGPEVEVPADAEIVDLQGKTLLPGLWDMHVHLSPGDGLQHIAAGVTSVRDLANDTDGLLKMKGRIEAGEEIGPRVSMSGILDGRGPFAGPTKVLVDTEDEAKAAIDRYASLGYTGVKIYSSIKPELVPRIIELAHGKGLRASGHVPAFMTAEQFVRAGADEIQHINFLFLNFFFDEVKDTRTPARFTAVVEHAATLDLKGERVRAFVKLLKERKTVVDPTVNIYEGLFTDRPGKIATGFAAVADRLPPQVRRSLLTGGLPVPEGKDARYRDSTGALLRMVKLLYDSGVPIVAGTDSLPGFALHRELELYAEAGIPPKDVLRMATLGAARVMKRDSELGSIAPGKLADLIVVDGNPVKRIGDIRRVSLVIKDGSVYEPAALYKSLGVRP